MLKVKKDKKERPSSIREIGEFIVWVSKGLKFILKIPFYIINWIYKITRKAEEKHVAHVIEEKREAMTAKYVAFNVLKNISGNYEKWEDNLFESESKIGIIVGARGSGKTAFGVKLVENLYSKKKRDCYAMGFDQTSMPSWIKVVENSKEIPNNSFVLVDEGGILFSSRRAMTNANKILGDLLLISRHKNISILFIAQNTSNLDVNIIRQADYIVLKPSALLQKSFERKIIKEIYVSVEQDFKKLEGKKGLVYIYSDDFRGFVSNELPSFWSIGLSKSFRDRK